MGAHRCSAAAVTIWIFRVPYIHMDLNKERIFQRREVLLKRFSFFFSLFLPPLPFPLIAPILISISLPFAVGATCFSFLHSMSITHGSFQELSSVTCARGMRVRQSVEHDARVPLALHLLLLPLLPCLYPYSRLCCGTASARGGR